MSEKMKHIFVDIDSLLYRAAVKSLETIEVGEGHFIEAFNLQEALNILHDFLAPMYTTETEVKLFGRYVGEDFFNYRKIVNKSYKANRKHSRKPVGLGLLTDMFYGRYPVIVAPSFMETDDVISIEYTNAVKSGAVVEICSVDKDFKALADVQHPILSTPQGENKFFWYMQSVMGDTADGVQGLKGVGIKTVEKAFSNVKTKEEAEEVCIEMYNKRGVPLHQLYINYLSVALLLPNQVNYQSGTITAHVFGKEFTINLNNHAWGYDGEQYQ